ncbi:YkuS family protein [Alkaliphilus crotonatoxidans]|jgi:hypothetical protein
MKRVAVQDNLESIRGSLIKRGYHVVSFDFTGPVDAVIYTDQHGGLENINNGVNSNEMGAVLINGKNKGIDEIIYIIEKRRYGSLFS